jgi:hypothetical protein
MWEIANDPNSSKIEKINATRLATEIYDKLMDLSTHPKTLNAAVEYITKKKQGFE